MMKRQIDRPASIVGYALSLGVFIGGVQAFAASDSTGGSSKEGVVSTDNLNPDQVNVKGSKSSGTTGSYGRKSGSSVQGMSGDHSTSLGSGSAMSTGSAESGGDTSALTKSSSDQNSNRKMKHRKKEPSQ